MMIPKTFFNLLFVIQIFILFLSLSSAQNILTVDRDSSDIYHLSKVYDLEKDEQVFLYIVDDANSSAFEKLEAKIRLGSIYLYNEEYIKAIDYLEQATNTSIADTSLMVSTARYNLGMIYIHGKGVERDFKKAFINFSWAGLAGNTPAIEEVVVMCVNNEIDNSTIHHFIEKVYENFVSAVDEQSKEIAMTHLSLLANCPTAASVIRLLSNIH